MKILQIIKKHKWAILLAVISAVIIAYPQVYFRCAHQDVEQGIEIIGNSDEEIYLSWIQEARDGHPSLGNPYLKDGKGDPYLFQPLGPAIVAFLGKIFFLDLNNTILLSRFFFPLLCFLVIYGFAFLLSRDKLTALTSAVMVVLGSILLSRFAIFQLLSSESPRTAYLIFSRPVIPALSVLFFFGFLTFFWLFLEKKSWQWGILSAVVLGLSFYVYFYIWTFLFVFIGIFLLFELFQKKWQDVKRIILLAFGAILLAIPYFYNLYQASAYSTFTEVGIRHGVVETYAPTLGFLIPLLLAVFLLFFPRKYKQRYVFSLALLIAPFIVLNHQIITGQTLINAHYHWYFHTPLAIIFLLVIFFYWISQKKWEFFKKSLAALIIIASIYTGIFIQQASLAFNEKEMLEKQRYGPVMKWLNENARKEEIVFTDDELSHLIVIYTPLNVFYHSSVRFSLAGSEERLLNSLFIFYRLDGVGKDEVQEVFFRDRAGISSVIFGIHYRETTGSCAGIPDEILLSFVQQYQDSLSISTEEFLYDSWNSRETNYAVWDTKNYPRWQLDQYSFLNKIAEINDFVIYQID